MNWKRCLATGVLAAGFCLSGRPANAEEPPAPKKDEAPPAPKEAPKKKDPFFGDRFAMFLETRGGPASIDGIKNPVQSTLQLKSESSIDFSGNKSGQFTVGWTLPRGRGQYLLTYGAIADGNYELNAEGDEQAYTTGVPGERPAKRIGFLAPWWHVNVHNGVLTATQTPPVWRDPADDANGNTVPDPGELRYPTTTIRLIERVPKDLGNRIQTWDLVYRREFGGVRIHAAWTAGVRYLSAKGAIVTPLWLVGLQSVGGFGYSDGVVNHFIVMQQSTNGLGPMGSGELQFSFFRQRLTLYGKLQAAFLFDTLKADSGAFTYFAHDLSPDSPNVLPGNGRIQRNISKTSWNTTIEVGLRVKMLEGFHLIADWNRTGYLDTILLPTTVSIPQNSAQVALGTTALFVSRDLVVSTINLGLSFQF